MINQKPLQATPYTISSDDRVWFYLRDATKAARHRATRDRITVEISGPSGVIRWVNPTGDLVDQGGERRSH